MILSSQEVRACIFRGGFNDLLRELALEPTFVKLVKLQRGAQSDGTREELALKFFAYMHDRRRFKGPVTKFLNDYMAKADDELDLDESCSLPPPLPSPRSPGAGRS